MSTRLTYAMDAGLALPEERVLLIGAPADTDISALPGAEVVTGFKPDYDAWQRRDVPVSTAPDGPYAAVIVSLARARDLSETRIADACAVAPGGLIVVDGAKTDGVESMLKAVKVRVPVLGQVSKAHGKCFWFASSDAFADWAQSPSQNAHGDWVAPGVFSADAPDPGTASLLAALPPKLGRTVADLGAGWGDLARGVLTRQNIETLHLVEADHAALVCARRNVADPRAQFHWADATTWTPPAKLDAVVMNPPFHQGRRAEPQLGKAFIEQAARILSPQGQLWLVANRQLPYEDTLEARFRQHEEISGDARFKILHASRPRA